jgi:hypothetical protein
MSNEALRKDEAFWSKKKAAKFMNSEQSDFACRIQRLAPCSPSPSRITAVKLCLQLLKSEILPILLL